MSGAEELGKITRETITEKIVKQIRAQIERGKWKPGDKIPSERELILRFSVSRITVREAIKQLEAKGLLEVRVGEGTYVKKVDAEELVDPLITLLLTDNALKEVLEVRRIMEVQLAGLAAARATEKELRIMADSLKKMKQSITNDVSHLEADYEFHHAIAHASGNTLLVKMMNAIKDMLREAIKKTIQVPGSNIRAYEGHKFIFNKIKERDVDGAKLAMYNHLQVIENDLIEAQKNGAQK